MHMTCTLISDASVVLSCWNTSYSVLHFTQTIPPSLSPSASAQAPMAPLSSSLSASSASRLVQFSCALDHSYVLVVLENRLIVSPFSVPLSSLSSALGKMPETQSFLHPVNPLPFTATPVVPLQVLLTPLMYH